MLSRRHILAGISVAATPIRAFAATADDSAIRFALDEAAMLPPDRALRLLEPLCEAGASIGRRLDLQAARAGLRIDLALAQAPRSAAHYFSLKVQRITGNDAQLPVMKRDLEAAHRALTARAAALFDQLGTPGRSVGARYEALWRDPRYLFPDDAAGRVAAVESMRATLAAIRPRLPHLLGSLPAECLAADVRALDPAEVAAGKGGYRILPAAGVRGTYVADLKDIGRRPRFSLPSVVAHELLPGHMAQMPLEALAQPHPLRLRYAAAFTEGWGSYAEMLMAQDGLFAAPHDMLGHIHWMLFRVCRGLADIGLHVRGESIEQALAQARESMGEPVYFAPFLNDIAKIGSDPAVRAAEAWLPLRLARVRPRDRATWPRFHEKLLNRGRCRMEQMLPV